MILELDAGNSRIKWRIIAGGDGRTLQARGVATDLPDLARQLAGQDMAAVERLRASSVRGEVFTRELAALARDTWRLQAEFARVTASAAGVTNAYTETGTMGVDRWMAILAAFDRARGACCVLDCGSAMTFDWVNEEGGHQGGFIVPGLELMKASLAAKARALDIPLRDWTAPVPGTNTADAIAGGILAMVCGFAEHCHDHAVSGGDDISWFLTGGDARTVGDHLHWPHTVAEDLVLDGLALALP